MRMARQRNDMAIDPKIFKAYDVRGLMSEVTPEAAERVARAVVRYTGASTVVVGRDMRETSPALAEAVMRGVSASGADVIDIGLTSTPMFYYAVGMQFESDPSAGAGIMVTASHNPKEYNGLKIVRGNLLPIGEGSGMEEIRDLALAGEFADSAEGNVLEIDVREEYVEKHLSLVPKRDIGSPSAVFDAGNGMAGWSSIALLEAYGLLRHGKKLFFDLDGNFPNHVPNPLVVENLAAVIAAVKKENADLGVSYDGDADRVGFVDENGQPVRGDIVGAIIAREVLRLHPGKSVLWDIRCSRVVAEEIAAAGGVPVMSRVGHAFIKKQMREIGACFAGELSTHYYFSDFYVAESSDLAMLYVLSAMKRSGKKLSELAAPLMRYRHSGEINFQIKDKAGLMKELERRLGEGAEISRIDGLRFDHEHWWFNVRPSNTEPLVRLNLEAETEGEMKSRVEEISEIIKGF